MCQQCQPHYTHWLISFIYMILSSKLRSAFWSHAVLWFSAKINLIFHFSVSVCNIGLPRTVCVDSSRIASSITHQHHLSPSHSPSSWPCDLDPASSWPLDFFLHDLWPSFQVNDLHIDIWPSTQVSDLDLFIMTFDFFTCMTLHTTLSYDLLFKFLPMTFELQYTLTFVINESSSCNWCLGHCMIFDCKRTHQRSYGGGGGGNFTTMTLTLKPFDLGCGENCRLHTVQHLHDQIFSQQKR